MAFTDEQLFDVFMTPHLSRLFPRRALVNSENFPWLQTLSNDRSLDQKPDFFLCPASFYSPRTPNTATTLGGTLDAERKAVGGDFRFGVLADWRLRDAVCVFESKLKLTAKALGEVLIYHEWLGCSSRRAMLFDKTAFWLVESQGRVVTRFVEGAWTTLGSVDCIQEFFPLSPWDQIETVCEMLGVSFSDPLTSGRSSFLGAGGSGRVVRVLLRDGSAHARGHATCTQGGPAR
jgi:hypothetical protein